MALPETGKHKATAQQTTVYEKDNGVLVCAIHFEVTEDEAITGYFSLSRKDGSLNQYTIDNLKDVFGWDGCDPFWLVDEDLSEVLVSITVEDIERDDGSYFRCVKYLDKPGGGGGMPEEGDRDDILAKFGARFRAMSGGKQVASKKAAPPKKKAPAPPAPPEPELPAGLGPMDMQEAWGGFCERAGDLNEEDLAAAWWKAIEATGKTAEDLTPEEWGRVAASAEKFAA